MSDRRPDIQGLRAIAVGIVIVYHLYPTLLPGGFVGVDVFFVISGFLITGQLAGVMQRTGRVRLLDFYGRRLRRLMPSAVLVLAVTWLVSLRVLPTTQLPATAEQIRASALYFQNWLLAHDAVGYLTADDAATPVQHFWSLSVEEQFYAGWPLLFLIAGGLTVAVRHRRQQRHRRHQPRQRRPVTGMQVMLGFAVAVFTGSLAYSAIVTPDDPAGAYFFTTTRLWELALGGMLALAPAAVTSRLARRGELAWVGLAMIGGSAFLITGSSAFPGTVALWPVVGAALLIACGGAEARHGPVALTSLRPMTFLGDISYPLYLWHWPIIVLWKAYSGGRIGPYDGTAIVVASVVLSWLTTVLVERPFRRGRVVTKSTWRSIAVAVLVVVPVTMVTVFLAGQQPTPSDQVVAEELNSKHPGASVLVTGRPAPTASTIPALSVAAHNFGAYGTGPGGCQTPQDSSALTQCRWGDTTHYTRTIALVGDSVAGEWFGDINALAKKRHWLLITDLHSLCPWTATLTRTPHYGGPYTSCQQWGRNVLHALVTTIKPALVITSERPTVGTPQHRTPHKAAFQQIARGMATYWTTLLAHGIGVAAIRESPEMPFNVPDCLSTPGATIAGCSAPAAEAVLTGTPLIRATRMMHGQVPLIDLTRYICSPTTCAPVVGNVVVYIDDHHVTDTYARTVGPYLDQQLLDESALR